jgi:acetyl esterase/lipase
VITIHGGGFVSGSRADAVVIEAARHLAQAGYVACSIDYRLVDPRALHLAWPAPLDDVQRAVRWVRAHAGTYGIDPQRVGAFGFSAGAGLAAHLGLRETRDNTDPALAAYSSRVRCVVDLAGPTDGTRPWTDPSAIALGVAVLGDTFGVVPDVSRDASPLFHVDAAAAPFLIVHGTQDSIVPVAQAQRLVAALHEVGVEVTYIEFPAAGHDVFAWDRSGPLALAFLGRHLEPER